MDKGDFLQLTISDNGANGEGISHIDDYTVFVPYTLSGEKVKARVTHVKGNLVFTKLIAVDEASGDRVPAICANYGVCGGCSLMHAKYDLQLAIKRQNVINVLKKNANCDFPVDNTVPSPRVLEYRNKIQLPFGFVGGKTVLGFFKLGTHDVVPISECPLHGEWASKLIEVVLRFVRERKIPVYNETSGRGLLRHLVARRLGRTTVVTLVINGKAMREARDLAEALRNEFDDVSLYLSINTNRNNVIMGDEIAPVYAPPQTVEISGVKMAVNPLSFFQINDAIREAIYSDVVASINLSDTPIVIDAYSGVGLLGAILAKKGAQIFNIEIIPEAIEDAKRLYAANGLSSQATHICGDSAKELPKLISEQNIASDSVVIIDPPRKGCDPAVLNAILKAAPKQVIYISCNPATLSRDLSLLLPAYTPLRITPYDMFPQTNSVETLICLSKKS